MACRDSGFLPSGGRGLKGTLLVRGTEDAADEKETILPETGTCHIQRCILSRRGVKAFVKASPEGQPSMVWDYYTVCQCMRSPVILTDSPQTWHSDKAFHGVSSEA